MGTKLTLAITTIGDLLIKNQITKKQDGNPHNVVLSIPNYQRPYKWTAKNANQLLDDIEEAMLSNKEVYRVGTLILCENNGVHEIVDGQQRTITFSLLLKCLGEEKIDFLGQQLTANSHNLHNVVNNYRALERRLERMAKSGESKELENLRSYIKDRCELIVVITDDLSEAFQFFDSQNARGKELYPHDLLKAYHLREMNNLDVTETEKIVKTWEDLSQRELAELFNEYLYRLKEWVRGNRSGALRGQNIDLFKGITSKDNHPYAQFYKSAYAYADDINTSQLPFVTGIQELPKFQLNAPIIAGKPFFEYTKHYFDILSDIRDNDKYEGYFIKDNEIVKTLDSFFKKGVGNGITRKMFDTALLLYVDRFCPDKPNAEDTEYLEQFVVYAFVWAYSMRAQYTNVGWQVAQNYIMGANAEITNSFNVYKTIVESESPSVLLSKMADKLIPLKRSQIKAPKFDFANRKATEKGIDGSDVYAHYLSFFCEHKYLED